LAYAKRFYDRSWRAGGKFAAGISWLRMLKYEHKMLERFSGVVVLTQPEADFLAQLAPSVKVFRHGMGVDCEYFAPMPLSQQERALVFMGNFRHSPNVSAALWLLRDIWPLITRKLP